MNAMPRYYEGPYWTVEGGETAQWRDGARHYGWTDEDSRRAASNGDEAWYWSAQQRAFVAVEDGITTTGDLAARLAAGAGDDRLAAQFWVDAADYLAERALEGVVDARWGHPDEGLADDLGRVPRLVDDIELAVAEQRRAHANAALVEAQQIRDVAVDREDDARWGAETVDDDYHAAGAAAALAVEVNDAWRSAVDVEYDQLCADYGNDGHPEGDRHISAGDKAAQAAAAAAIAERKGLPTGAVWDAVRDVANRYALDHTDTATLGQPDWDQVADHWAALIDQNRADASGSEVPRWEREADQRAYWDELGESHPAVREAFSDARDKLGLTAGDDIDRQEMTAAYTAAGETITAAAGLPAPDPAAVIEQTAEASERDDRTEDGAVPADFDGTDAAQRWEIAGQWAAVDVPDDPAADHVEYWEQVADQAATAAAVSEPDPEGFRLYTQMLLEEARREVEADIEVGQVTDADALLAEMVDAITETSHDGDAAEEQRAATSNPDPVLWGSVAAELLDDLDQARAQLESGEVPEVDRAAHEIRIEHEESPGKARAADAVAAAHQTVAAELQQVMDEQPGSRQVSAPAAADNQELGMTSADCDGAGVE